MAQRPTVNDLARYMKIDFEPGSTPTTLEDVFGAALEGVESLCKLPEGMTSFDEEDSTGPSDLYPARMRNAVFLYGHRLYKRRTTPEGVAGFGELGVVRFEGVDPDLLPMLGNLLRMDGFA